MLCSQGSIITAVAGLKYGPRDTLVRWGILGSSCWILLFNPGLSEEREVPVGRHHHYGFLGGKGYMREVPWMCSGGTGGSWM